MSEKVITRVDELETRIAELPKGSISTKTVDGKEYYYHRWQENKKRKEKYVAREMLPMLKKQIEERKELEAELKVLRKTMLKKRNRTAQEEHQFLTNVRIGESLRDYSKAVLEYKKRTCYEKLHEFVFGNSFDKVMILYGLRRTGKTTMIRQILADMNDEDIRKAAFIQITAKNNLAEINKDLKYLESKGYRYIFIDEATLMEDFIEGAALFSDIFATCGMKIVLAGTDSLGFVFTEDEQLYDRCIMIHTTFISYKEFETILGIKGIDEYIRYGGTMSLSGKKYHEDSPFANKKNTDAYVDSAIARNIQHSLRCYQYEGHFRNLQELYDKQELTGAINRVVEDVNHRFTLEVLTRDFYSHDLKVSANNLRSDRMNPTDILDRVDISSITERLRNLLEIRNRSEQTVTIENAHRIEIKEYLEMLDLIQDIPVVYLPSGEMKEKRTLISQPGMRYAQAEALIKSLLLDEQFQDLSIQDRNYVTDRIMSEIKGRMMEDIVLLETKIANPHKEVFMIKFARGEFDMVIFDPQTSSCEIFEIKHSMEVVSQQYRHLIDEKKCNDTQHRYGTITGKYVLYRGNSQIVDGVQYVNVEEYLMNV